MPANLFPLGLAALGGLGRGLLTGQEAQQNMQYNQLRMQELQQQMALQNLRMQVMNALGPKLGSLPGGAQGWGPQMTPNLGGGGYGGGGYGMPTPYAPYAPGQIAAQPLSPLGSDPSQFFIPGTSTPVSPAPPPVSTAMPSGPDDPRLGGAGIRPAYDPSPGSSALAGETPSEVYGPPAPGTTEPFQTSIDLPGLARGVGSAADQTTPPSAYNLWYPRHGPAYPGDPGPMFGGGPGTDPAYRGGALPRSAYGPDLSRYYQPVGYGGALPRDPYGQYIQSSIPAGLPQPTGDPYSLYGGGYGGAQPQDPFTTYQVPPGAPASGYRATGPRGFPSRQELGLSQVTNEIYGLESSWGRNTQTNWAAKGGAHGPGQITPGTFNAYAQPGERIDDFNDNLRVMNRITTDLWHKSGGDSAAVMVGYNAGETAMRRFQAAGDDPNAVKLEPAYQRAVRQVQQGQFRTDLHAQMGGLPPQEQSMGSFGAQRTLAAMPNPLAMSGRMTMGGLARWIDQTNPNLSGAAKFMAFSMLYPMLESEQRYDFETQWKMYVQGEHEREFGVTHEEHAREFDIRQAELTQPSYGTPEDYRITMPDGTTHTVAGMPITKGRGAGQIMVQDPKSGQMQPISTVYPGADYTRAPLKYDVGGTQHEKMIQVLDKDDNPVRTVRITMDAQGVQRDVDTGKPFTIDPAKGEHTVDVTPSGAMAERHAAAEARLGGSIDDYAKGLAEYRLAPLSSWTLKSEWGKKVMARTLELNPRYDAAQWIARTSGVRALASGRLGDTLGALNTVADHIMTLNDLVDHLAAGDTSSRSFNMLKNYIGTEFGWTAALDFHAARQIVADEINKAVIPGAGGEREREALSDNLNAANTPEQLRDVINTFETLIGGQFNTIHRRIVGGGIHDEEWFRGQLSDEALGMFDRHRAGGAGRGQAEPSAPMANGGGRTTTTPPTQTYRYDSQGNPIQ